MGFSIQMSSYQEETQISRLIKLKMKRLQLLNNIKARANFLPNEHQIIKFSLIKIKTKQVHLPKFITNSALKNLHFLLYPQLEQVLQDRAEIHV